LVAKLEELMSFCDSLKQSIKESQGYNEKLLQQFLREVLQGGKQQEIYRF
jgi:type I restriction enzyme S subunit